MASFQLKPPPPPKTGKSRTPSPGESGGEQKSPKRDQSSPPPSSPRQAWVTSGATNTTANKANNDKNAADEEKKPMIVMAQRGEWGALELALKYAQKEQVLNSEQYRDKTTNETVMMLAARDSRIVILERICELGANVNDRTTDKRTALHYACSNSRDEAVKVLLSKRADTVVAGGENSQLPLHIAASRTAGGFTIAQMLLRVMPKEGRLLKDALGNLAITYAIMAGSVPLVKELLTAFAPEQVKWVSREAKGDYLIHIAARKSEVEIVKCLVNIGGADVNAQNNDGQTALHIAARTGSELLVRALHSLRADSDTADKKHRTPLLIAAEHGRTTILEMLAERFKANVHLRTKDGSTLMHLASEKGHADTVLAFIKRGVPLFMPNKSGTLCLHAAAQNGHVKVVKTLIQKGTPVDAQTKDGYTALHLSVLQNRPDIIQTLLGYGAEVDLKGGAAMETPLHIAARLPDGLRSAEMLLKSGASVNETTEETGESPLHITARNGFLDLLKMLLAEGADATQTSKQGETALHLAVRHCHYDIAKALILFVKENRSAREATNLVNVANNEGETCLHLGAELGKSQAHFPFEDVDMIRLLLENGADNMSVTRLTTEIPLHYCARSGNAEILQEIVWQMGHNFQSACNRQAKNGWSPLMTACEQGHAAIAEILLQNNARVDVFDEHGKAALHLAAENGHINCCETLLTYKAFINAKSKLGITPLHLAAQNGFVDLIKLLIEKYRAAMDANSLAKKTPLHLAAEAGRKEVCQLLLNLRADANATDALGQTPLHLAAENDHSDVVKLFMKYKPELVTTASKSGMTCAHIAANKGSVAVIKELMRFNKAAVTSARNKTNDSLPIHLAAAGGHKEVVRVLIETGASAVDENAEGMTAIHLAAKEGFVEVFDIISPKSLLRTASIKNGLSPIHVAAFFGKAEVVRELLLQVNASLKTEAPQYAAGMSDKALKDLISNDYGLTCLHLASFSGHESVVRLLLNIPGVQTDEQTAVLNVCPMHYAASNGHLTIISLLLSKSTEHLHLQDKRGRTPLHLAAENGHVDMVSMLLGQGSDINGLDKNHWTPLMYAAKAGFLSVVKLLVDSGATTSQKTVEGKTALALSASAGHNDVLSYLLSKDHDTWQLVDDHGFVFDLMLCGKANKNQSIEELVMHSKAPLDTAAKLAKLYRVLALKEKERARDLNETGKHCEHMATELLGIAANMTAPSTVLRATDCKGRQFLDSLLEDDLKEVVSNAAVQRYLSDIWTGSLSTWSMGRMILLFLSFLCCPIIWAIFTLPLPHKYHKIPIVKFMGLLVSHVYFLTILTFVAVIPLHPIVDREHMTPDWLEILLLLNVSGMMVAELTNNSAGRTGLGLLRPVIVVICVLAAFIHTILLMIDYMWDDHDLVVLLMYIRNQFLSLAIFSGIVLIVEFLTFHYLFGPFAIIISTLMSDVMIFLVVLFLFIAGFALQVSCVYSPLRTQHQGEFNETATTYTVDPSALMSTTPGADAHGGGGDAAHNVHKRSTDDVLAEASSVFLSYVTNAANGTRYRRSAGGGGGGAVVKRLEFTESDAAKLDLTELGDTHMVTTTETGEKLIRIYKCPAPGPKFGGKVIYEPVEEFSNEDGTTVIRLFTIFFFALYGIGNPNVLPKVDRGPYWGQHITKISYGIYMLLCIVVLINLLVAMLVETYKAIHNKSDSEWKFGRAKLIRDMIKMAPTPAPLNLFWKPCLYLRSFIRHGRLMCTVYANYYVTLDEHAGDDEILDTQVSAATGRAQAGAAKKSFGKRLLRCVLCRCFKPDTDGLADSAVVPLQSGQDEHHGAQTMEQAIDWATVVKKYQVMKAEEAEHEGHGKHGAKHGGGKHGADQGAEHGAGGEHGAKTGESAGQGAAGGAAAGHGKEEHHAGGHH